MRPAARSYAPGHKQRRVKSERMVYPDAERPCPRCPGHGTHVCTHQLAQAVCIMCPWLGSINNAYKIIYVFLQVVVEAVANGEEVHFPGIGKLYCAPRWGARSNVIYMKMYLSLKKALNPNLYKDGDGDG